VQQGVLRLIVDAPQADTVSVRIRNASGMEVMRTQRGIGQKGPAALSLNLMAADFSAGVYWVQVEGSSGVWGEAKWVNP
jgi:hypothetical protein